MKLTLLVLKMGLILELAKARREITTLKIQLEDKDTIYPTPPMSYSSITSSELRNVLHANGLYSIHLGSTSYELSSLSEYKRFLQWYRDKHPYTLDEYDCNVYALVQMAEASKWMHGKFVWGLEWGEGLDPNYTFPNHGFNFIVDYLKNVYFCDELRVAAPHDDFIKAYEIKSNLTMA